MTALDPVAVAWCETSPHAHLLRGRLEAEGMAAFVADEHLADWHWLCSCAAGGASVCVAAGDAAPAVEILAERPDAGTDDEEDPALSRCVSCGSTALERDLPLRRVIFLVWAVYMIALCGPFRLALSASTLVLRPGELLPWLISIVPWFLEGTEDLYLCVVTIFGLGGSAPLPLVWRWWRCRSCGEWSRRPREGVPEGEAGEGNVSPIPDGS